MLFSSSVFISVLYVFSGCDSRSLRHRSGRVSPLQTHRRFGRPSRLLRRPQIHHGVRCQGMADSKDLSETSGGSTIFQSLFEGGLFSSLPLSHTFILLPLYPSGMRSGRFRQTSRSKSQSYEVRGRSHDSQRQPRRGVRRHRRQTRPFAPGMGPPLVLGLMIPLILILRGFLMIIRLFFRFSGSVGHQSQNHVAP